MQVSEVEKAKEELREHLKLYGDVEKYIGHGVGNGLQSVSILNTFHFRIVSLLRISKNLLNALDNFKTEAEPIADNKKEAAAHFVDANKKESKLPWKDVGELWNRKDFDNQDLILKMEDGKFIFGQGYSKDIRPIGTNSFMYHQLKNCITLTDLIDSIESMLSKEDEFEERIKKLEGKND